MHIFGQTMSAAGVLAAVETDSMFYTRSGGGLTLSGGEPLMQADFVEEVLKESKRRRIDTAIETTGFADWAVLERIGVYLKAILYDIKCMDPDKHKQFTGVANELILHNFVRLHQAFPSLKIVVRTPVIPGFNDTEADIGAILDFIRNTPNVDYELLPYHRLGQQKYGYLGRSYPMADAVLNNEKVKALQEFVKNRR
jgi:pyruvate formate lyase activating enzyme